MTLHASITLPCNKIALVEAWPFSIHTCM